MNDFPYLLAPIRLGRVEVRNRVVVTSHGASESFRNATAAPEAYIEYLRRRAGGGVGLIITQPVLSDPGSEISEEILHRHAVLAEAVRSEGAALLLQVTHLGVFARTDADLRRGPLPGFANSQSAMGETAHAMTDGEIQAMIDGYRRTAAMAAAAGFDGVEVHGAHGYLVQQSLTPACNARDDRWGDDRTLFVRSLLDVSREAIGPDRILSYRTPSDDLRSPEDGGIGAAGIIEIIRELLKAAQIDVLNTTIGDGGPSYARAIPIADPELIAKARAGRTHRIRPCVGANVCVNRKLQGYAEISCFHNPEVLRERALEPLPASRSRQVLIVGAGPAGLKAAATAALRGHQTNIADTATRPGGLLRYAEWTAALGLMSSVDYLVAELAESGVAVQTETVVDAATLRSARPDHVVVATGGRFVGRQLLPDAAAGVVVSSAEALSGDVGRRVMVYDTVGGPEGVLVAEAFAKRGRPVIFVTSFETVMPWGGALHRAEMLPILHKRAVQIFTHALVGDLTGDRVIVVRPDGATVTELDIDTLVAVCPPKPIVDLVPILEGLGIPYQVVGDALAPRGAVHAFKEGHESALAI